MGDLDLFFGYYDGDRRVVDVKTEPGGGKGSVTQGFAIRGELLTKVCAAALYMTGHAITPGLKSLGLRVAGGGPRCPEDMTTIESAWIDIEEDTVSVRVGCWHKGLRLWVDSGPMWQSYYLDKEETAAFIDRLCEAAEWPVEESAA